MAGERFLRGLKEGRLIAGRCSRCRETRVPARMYCVNCYVAIKEFVEVGPAGKVAAFTTTSEAEGRPGRAFAFVVFDGATGGLVHRAEGELKIGSRVAPRFLPQPRRRGSIDDIVCFEPR